MYCNEAEHLVDIRIYMLPLHICRDIMSYNEAQTVEEAQEESGWKLVHGQCITL